MESLDVGYRHRIQILIGLPDVNLKWFAIVKTSEEVLYEIESVSVGALNIMLCLRMQLILYKTLILPVLLYSVDPPKHRCSNLVSFREHSPM